MNAMMIQLVGSAVAVAAMVGLAAWARIPRQAGPLDDEAVRALLAIDYPDHPLGEIWIAADAAGAIVRSGDRALVLTRLGDSWVTRDLAWTSAVNATIQGGRVRLRLSDPSAPRLSLAVSGVNPWPPQSPQELAA